MFISNLKVELINNEGKRWKVLEDLEYEYNGIKIVVPAGYKTDFASVPRIHGIFELVGNMGHAAATVHDYLYSTGMLSRKDSDKVLLQALRATEVGKPRSMIMYAGVRAFGWLFYKK